MSAAEKPNVLGYLEHLFALHCSEEVESCLREFHSEQKNGQVDIHFSQGAIASIDVSENCDNCAPGHDVGAVAPERAALFAAARMRWMMGGKKSGRVSLFFQQGLIASVKSFVRFSPNGKRAVDKNAGKGSV